MEPPTGSVSARQKDTGAASDEGFSPVVDPVVVWDAMWEAGTSLLGSYVWLEEHAEDDVEAAKWLKKSISLIRRRERLDTGDIAAQQKLMAEFIAEEKALRHLVKV